MVNRLFFLLLVAFSSSNLIASERDSINKNPVDTSSKSLKIIGLPLVFYTPETKLGFGASGISTFKMKEDSLSRISSIQFGLAFTQMKQVLVYLPFQLWLKSDLWNINGELGYYKYNYFYYGIGTNSSFENQERYDVNYPRLRLNVLKQLKKNHYLGFRYFFDNYSIKKREPEGSLSQNIVPGSAGGVVSSLGLVYKIDSRDYQFNATKGIYFETALQLDNKIWGASFEHIRLTIDYSRYKQLKWKHIVAGNLFTSFGNGTVPFYQMALLGGGKKMRGFYEGRFRDKNAWTLQGEYRATIWKRIGMVAFLSVGDVASRVGAFKFQTIKVAYGTGLRVLIDKNQKINLRLDVAWAEPKPNFYLTLTEAF